MRGPLAVLLLLAAAGVQAGLFDDEEARKAILDLRARIQAADDAGRARVGARAGPCPCRPAGTGTCP